MLDLTVRSGQAFAIRVNFKDSRMTDAPETSPAVASGLLSRAAAVVGHRKTISMMVFGFTAGLPNVLLIGTLNFWLSKAGVDLVTIGVLSWIGLAYAFKFLWSPAVNAQPIYPFRLLGRRRGWILMCQIVITACVAVISTLDPAQSLGILALAAAIAALASATQDMAIDTWRIEEAEPAAPLDLLSAVYQFGYRTASFVGGAGALLLAGSYSWNFTYAVEAAIFALAAMATFAAPESPIQDDVQRAPSDHVASTDGRFYAVCGVLAAWAWAGFEIIHFMIRAVNETPAPSASSFTSTYGPWIIVATVIFPCGLAAWISRTASSAAPAKQHKNIPAFATAQADRLYSAILEPLVELMGRLGLAAVLILFVILSYRITDSIWGPFAGPFYLVELKHTEQEVALASKIWGVIMTIAGVGLGAISLVWLGRLATLFIGAVAASVTNLLFADLAWGGVYVDAFLKATGLMDLAALFYLDDRMARLMTAIAGENVAAGYAGAAFVAYLSSLASKMHGAVQFAVFTSLTMLIGTLGRGALGEMIKTDGYADVFILTMWLGAIGVVACALEWWRQSRLKSN
jgi:MFS transporter, PAT family, beta-lactamase induction signal transducer AmpG